MRWKPHVRFGGRAAETHPSKDGQGAAARPLLATIETPSTRPLPSGRGLHASGRVDRS
jgi:hypothetical protein